MPDVPSYSAPASGVLTSDALSQQLFQRQLTPSNQAVANGQLTDANRKTGWTIKRHMVQPETWTKGGMSAGNSNLDFFYDPYFVGANLAYADPTGDSTPGYSEMMRTVIGRTWYNHRAPKAVWVMFHAVGVMDSAAGLSYDTDGDGNVDYIADTDSNPQPLAKEYESGWRLALFVNDKRIECTDHRFKMGLNSMVESDDLEKPYEHWSQSQPDLREYSGAICIDPALISSQSIGAASPLAVGWNTLDLRVVCKGGRFQMASGKRFWQPNINRPWGQVRIKTRRLAVLPLY
tara:strand:- start:265 stop:1134 length:870 start_codon:yes stop_codon:yes gene_type:complete